MQLDHVSAPHSFVITDPTVFSGYQEAAPNYFMWIASRLQNEYGENQIEAAINRRTTNT